MGYSTYYTGEFTIDPPLNAAEIAFINSDELTSSMAGFSPESTYRPYFSDWAASEDGTKLSIEEESRSGNTANWLEFIITDLLAPTARTWIDSHRDANARLGEFTCDHTVNGEVKAEGEDSDDRWEMMVTTNRLIVKDSVLFYGTEYDEYALDAIDKITSRQSIENKTLLAIRALLTSP